jgi:hypothetical protein
VGLSPLSTAATSGLLYKPQLIDEGDCGAVGEKKNGRGNRNTRRKPAPAPLCPPQIPHDQIRARTRVAAVGSQRLTAWAMARPLTHQHLLLAPNIFQNKSAVGLSCRRWQQFTSKLWQSHRYHGPEGNDYVFRFTLCGYESGCLTLKKEDSRCRIWGSHSGGYEELHHLGHNAM